jgi:hypothetical protein
MIRRWLAPTHATSRADMLLEEDPASLKERSPARFVE